MAEHDGPVLIDGILPVGIGRLSFHGGVDIVTTLRNGTPDEVRAEARERVATLGADGGYIMCSSHHIQSDSPLENVLALYETDLRLGVQG